MGVGAMNQQDAQRSLSASPTAPRRAKIGLP
jgi:hypothetical protein